MTIHLTVPATTELKPRIIVMGVGGAGGNAVNNMIVSGLEGVEFVVANTDAQALALSKADRRIQIGGKFTEGLGAGADPEIGRQAAEESINEVMDVVQGAHMLFVTAGMGGGTGTGAAPVIARAAREMGVLTVGVTTKPFEFEGTKRMRAAETGIAELADVVDTLVIIPNQNIFRIASQETTFSEAFAIADEVLYNGVASITDLMVRPGLINLDFADVRRVMHSMGRAMMGTGEASGEDRALKAASDAIANPLLDEVSLSGARGVLVNITGGNDLGLYDVETAANYIRMEVAAEADIIVGSAIDERLDGLVRVSVVAAGLMSGDMQQITQDDNDGSKVVSFEPKPYSEEGYDEEVSSETETPEDDPTVEDTTIYNKIQVPRVETPETGRHGQDVKDTNIQEGNVPRFFTPGQTTTETEVPKRTRSFLNRLFGTKQDDVKVVIEPSRPASGETPIIDQAEEQILEPSNLPKSLAKDEPKISHIDTEIGNLLTEDEDKDTTLAEQKQSPRVAHALQQEESQQAPQRATMELKTEELVETGITDAQIEQAQITAKTTAHDEDLQIQETPIISAPSEPPVVAEAQAEFGGISVESPPMQIDEMPSFLKR